MINEHDKVYPAAPGHIISDVRIVTDSRAKLPVLPAADFQLRLQLAELWTPVSWSHVLYVACNSYKFRATNFTKKLLPVYIFFGAQCRDHILSAPIFDILKSYFVWVIWQLSFISSKNVFINLLLLKLLAVHISLCREELVPGFT